jgi:hypothetical protein
VLDIGSDFSEHNGGPVPYRAGRRPKSRPLLLLGQFRQHVVVLFDAFPIGLQIGFVGFVFSLANHLDLLGFRSHTVLLCDS